MSFGIRWGFRPRVAARWVAIVAAAVAVGEGGQALGFPAAHLVGSLMLGVLLALSNVIRDQVPRRVNLTTQSLLGLSMGTYVTASAVSRLAQSALPLLAVTVATVVVSLGIAIVATRVGRIGRATAALGMMPGGSAAVVASADDVGADARLVAVMQYLRLAVVAVSAPMIVQWVASAPQAGGSPRPGDGPWRLLIFNADSQVVSLVAAVALVLVGRAVGRLFRLPSAALLGPMLIAAIVTASPIDLEFAPAGALEVMMFTMVGLDVGLRFTRATVLRLRKLLPLVLACTIVLNVVVALLASGLSALTSISLSDALLATTPGGINAVLATAAATGSDVGLISAVQSLRLFLMMALIPLVKIWATRRRTEDVIR
ncbi:AbrB family transcriptional regulator [Actinocrispum wychmicini]|nr:AbrB family transcriptional regulator [Actinocrispum wychmicini]